jgi:hypothetical protein
MIQSLSVKFDTDEKPEYMENSNKLLVGMDRDRIENP